jgi:hypothetical protein
VTRDDAMITDLEELLLARLNTGSWDWVGVSSNAMIEAAVRGTRVDPHNYPWDQGDLSRCEETYKRSPPWLQRLMLPILEQFRVWVARYERACTPGVMPPEGEQVAAAVEGWIR